MSVEVMGNTTHHTDRPRQSAQLRRIMQEVDIEWETLTQSIQADQELLAVLQRQTVRCHQMLTLQRERAPMSPSDLATLEQKMIRLEQQLFVENLRRNVLT